MGGEEFLVLALGNQAFESLEDYMQKYNKLIYNRNFDYKNISIRVSITAGITSFIDETSVNDMISRADRLLYDGKKNGKNCIVCK